MKKTKKGRRSPTRGQTQGQTEGQQKVKQKDNSMTAGENTKRTKKGHTGTTHQNDRQKDNKRTTKGQQQGR